MSSNTNEDMIEYFLEMDDDTYYYGDKNFMVRCDKDGKHIEPYIREEPNNRIVKFYRDKQFFVIYDNNIITEIIYVSTCWSDDIIAYKVRPDKIANYVTEYYHGQPRHIFKECSIDLSDFIAKNDL